MGEARLGIGKFAVGCRVSPVPEEQPQQSAEQANGGDQHAVADADKLLGPLAVSQARLGVDLDEVCNLLIVGACPGRAMSVDFPQVLALRLEMLEGVRRY